MRKLPPPAESRVVWSDPSLHSEDDTRTFFLLMECMAVHVAGPKSQGVIFKKLIITLTKCYGWCVIHFLMVLPGHKEGGQ